MSEQFAGFELPKENWSKLPHSLIDHLYLMTSEAEVKVVLYILRHTWGFGEFEEHQAKHITTDEFENGRKRLDGTRLDNGTGLTKPSIYDGLKRAVEHGFLLCFVDNTDRGRVTHYYQLRHNDDKPGRVYAIDPEQIKTGDNSTPWHWLSKTDKQAIYNKFSGRCAYCEGKSKMWHYDHIFPKAKGGPDDPANVALACPTCNMAKRDRSPDQWGKQVIVYEDDVKTFYREWERFVPDDVKSLYITQSKVFTPPGKDSLPRTEKETNRNKPSKEASDKSHSPNGELPPPMTHSHTPLDLPLEPGKKSSDKNGLGKATNGSRKTEDGGQAAPAAPGPKTVIRDKFCQLTNLAMPGLKSDANFWWSQFGELHRIGGGGLDLTFTLAMVEAVVNQMKQDKLTISGPQSIVNLCRTFAAEHSQNGNGNGYAKPVLEKAKDGGVYV